LPSFSHRTRTGAAGDSLPREWAPSCTVVIPTFNERENLPPLVAQLMELPRVRVLVVDDGSPDGTGDAAERLAGQFPGRIDVIHRPGPGGLGSAYIEGMQRALAFDTDLIAQMDADLSHDVRYLPAMMAATAGADLVIGSRYVPGGGVSNWSLDRRLLSRFANFYVRVVTGLPVRDATAGYRCWRRETLLALPLRTLKSNGYSFQVEMAWETARRGLRVTEVPIVFVERAQGRSKMNRSVILESVVMPWRLRRKQVVSPT
jgi:dolichol-phosphate mannosyltransferase